MRYSDHAQDRMNEYGVGAAEVAAIVANPTRGIYEPPARDRREHLGFAADGRPLNVVTTRDASIVVTIVLQ